MEPTLQPTALSIAGSDPSGGAGIQADIKTFTAIGVYCGAAVTSITCQNTRGVRYFSPLSPELVRDQVESVLSDLQVSHIKIGMLGSPGIARALGEILDGFTGEIIFDPVMVAGSGDSLYRPRQKGSDVEDARQLIKLATVITPNLNELEVISGTSCPDSENACKAAERILAEFPRLRAVCLTGGHLDEDPEVVTDFLIVGSLVDGVSGKPEIIRNSHPLVQSNNLHGTGCTFSSAYTAYHFLTGKDREAFTLASGFTARLIEDSRNSHIGLGNGPLLHFLHKDKYSG